MTEPFFSNRELYDRFEKEIKGLTKELTITQVAVKKYNGLRQKVEEVDNKVDGVNGKLEDVCEIVNGMVSEGTGKNKVLNGFVVAVGLVGTLIGIAGAILVIANQVPK